MPGSVASGTLCILIDNIIYYSMYVKLVVSMIRTKHGVGGGGGGGGGVSADRTVLKSKITPLYMVRNVLTNSSSWCHGGSVH